LLKVRSGSKAEANARDQIERIAKEYSDALAQYAISPLVADARDRIKGWADKLDALAKDFRQGLSVLQFGSATHNPLDGEDVRARDRQELEDLQQMLLAEAERLEAIAGTLRERRSRWQGKNTGALNVLGMAHGAPEPPFVRKCLKLFAEHRSDDDTHASSGGELFALVHRVYEIATGNKPKPNQFLFDLRKAVTVHRAAQ
jgi:hypothetical protein